MESHAAGLDVARLHSGDLSIYSALAEQLRRLERQGIPYTLTPGVPAFAAAAAVLGRELTVPGLAQSVVLTRMPGRASRMPEAERLATFAASGATLAIHLAIHAMDAIVEQLIPHYGPDCPVAVVMRASWPDERILAGPARRHPRPAGARTHGAHGVGIHRPSPRCGRFCRERAVFDRLPPTLP